MRDADSYHGVHHAPITPASATDMPDAGPSDYRAVQRAYKEWLKRRGLVSRQTKYGKADLRRES